MNSPTNPSIQLLGGAAILGQDGLPLAGRPAQRHRIALLALLSTAPEHATSRDKLIGYLWPESDTERARKRLSVSVYVLRQALGDEAIRSEGNELRLDPRVCGADVIEFFAAIEAGEFGRAVRLYKGPFLDGFFLSNAPEFEHWAQRERERVSDSYAHALEVLASSAEEAGNLAAAVESWKAKAKHDPYDSRLALRLMRALDSGGNPAGALRHAAMHRRLLENEFGIEPPPELLALESAIRARIEQGATSKTISVAGLRAHPSKPAAGPHPGPTAYDRSAPQADVPIAAGGAATQRQAGYGGARYVSRLAKYAAFLLLLAAVILAGLQLLRGDGEAPGSPSENASIAVLPLANLSGDPNDALLAAGLTEDLTSVLARTGSMRVVGGTSAIRLRETDKDLRRIADSLGVSNLLVGGFQKVGSRLLLQVRLVDARDGSTRWSEIYDRELNDVFDLQDEIAHAVARELDLRLTGGRSARSSRTRSIPAYELYLRGTDPILLRSDSTRAAAIEYFSRSIELDPNYAAPYLGLAKLHLAEMLNIASHRSAAESHRRAEVALRMAVALADSLPETRYHLGFLHFLGYDFDSAEKELRLAAELDPGNARVHEALVQLYVATGRREKALEHARLALSIEPLSPSAIAEFARALYANGRCDEALQQLQRIAELQPKLQRAAAVAAQCYARNDMWSEAIGQLESLSGSGGPGRLALIAYMHGRAGQRREAERLHRSVLDLWSQGEQNAFAVAISYLALGDRDGAFDWLARSAEDRTLRPELLPTLEELHSDPRYERLLRSLGIQKR